LPHCYFAFRLQGAIKAEFSIGENRKAEKLRLDFEDGVKKIEFSRIET
jgi:hypothetical protein